MNRRAAAIFLALLVSPGAAQAGSRQEAKVFLSDYSRSSISQKYLYCETLEIINIYIVYFYHVYETHNTQ